MKLRISSFKPNATVLRKDLTRFAPLWGLYLVGTFLIMQTSAMSDYHFDFAQELGRGLTGLSVINAAFALIAAQLLFGDLFNSRLCNAVHAMPVRRESLFVTHLTAGLAMSLLPNLLVSLSVMPWLQQFWYTALLWWLGMSIEYLFFFCLAVFCMLCTGNRFAAVAIYVLMNIFSLIALWAATCFYQPLLYGVKIATAPFLLFCPIGQLISSEKFWSLTHLDSCPCWTYEGFRYQSYQCLYRFDGLTGSWGYLAVLAGLAVVIAVAALLLYRRRHLESAGDFVAFRPMAPVFLVVYTVCVGAFLQLMSELFSTGTVGGYIFLFIGLLIGFFTGQMLLTRTVRVFRKKNWARLGILMAMLLLSLVLTRLDILGITRYVPDAEEVSSVTIADGHLSDSALERLNRQYPASRGIDPSYEFLSSGRMTLTNEEDIRQILLIHALLVEERSEKGDRITVHYILKDGTTLTRYYRVLPNGWAEDKLNHFVRSPEFLFGTNSMEEVAKGMTYAYGYFGEVEDPKWQQSLATAAYQDALEGNVATNSDYSGNYINLEYQDASGLIHVVTIHFDQNAKNIQLWLEEYRQYCKDNGIKLWE